MTLAESPLCEDELMTADEAQRFIECSASARRKNYVGESAVRVDGLDRSATAADFPDNEIANGGRQRNRIERLRTD